MTSGTFHIVTPKAVSKAAIFINLAAQGSPLVMWWKSFLCAWPSNSFQSIFNCIVIWKQQLKKRWASQACEPVKSCHLCSVFLSYSHIVVCVCGTSSRWRKHRLLGIEHMHELCYWCKKTTGNFGYAWVTVTDATNFKMMATSTVSTHLQTGAVLQPQHTFWTATIISVHWYPVFQLIS